MAVELKPTKARLALLRAVAEGKVELCYRIGGVS